MSYFFCKLTPPRPTFMHDMNESERRIMLQHSSYWRNAMEAGKVVAFGPVADPVWPFGAGFVEMESEAEVEDFGRNDPAILSGTGFQFECTLMPNLVFRS